VFLERGDHYIKHLLGPDLVEGADVARFARHFSWPEEKAARKIEYSLCLGAELKAPVWQTPMERQGCQASALALVAFTGRYLTVPHHLARNFLGIFAHYTANNSSIFYSI
jgi:hypothetical protein